MKSDVLYGFGPVLLGFILDLIFGDPYNFPHIIRLLGKVISSLEKVLRKALPKTPKGEITGGVMLALIVAGGSFAGAFCLLKFLNSISFPLGFVIETCICYQLLAAKSLKTESMKVYKALNNGDLAGARQAVSMIVGRDTFNLDEAAVTRAAVETVAENASDGVIAPLFYMSLGGGALALLYKAVNTMDSMIGYKNEKYLYFGRAAAKLDDLLNFIPSRLCAWLMIGGAYLLKYDGKNAFRIWRKDRFNHQSPNSAQTEAACAGALNIRLGGPAWYFGKKHEKPYIGEQGKDIEYEDIVRANRLMYISSVMMLVLAVLMRALVLRVK